MFKCILSKPIHILGKPFLSSFLLLKYISIIDYLGISLFDISRSFFFLAFCVHCVKNVQKPRFFWSVFSYIQTFFTQCVVQRNDFSTAELLVKLINSASISQKQDISGAKVITSELLVVRKEAGNCCSQKLKSSIIWSYIMYYSYIFPYFLFLCLIWLTDIKC